MAIEHDCRGCRMGNHQNHKTTDRVDTGTTRLIGGTYCGCTGDCETRLAQAFERMCKAGLFVSNGAVRGY